MRKVVLGAWVVLLSLVGARMSAQRVERAGIGGDGLVHIGLEGKPEFIAPKEKVPARWSGLGENMAQQEVEDVTVAPDHHTVAWLVMYSNCCTSYPIGLAVVVVRDGRIISRLIGDENDPPVMFRFVFEAGGQQIATYSDMLHGDSVATLNLFEASTGRKLATWRAGEKPIPAWCAPFKQETDAANSSESGDSEN